MQNDNEPPVPPQEPLVRPVDKKFKLFPLLTILILIVVVLGALTSYLAYQNYLLSQKVAMLAKSPTPSATPASTETTNQDITSTWQTYTGNGFTFKYPPEYTKSTDVGLLNDQANNWIFGVTSTSSYTFVQDYLSKLCPSDTTGKPFCSITPSTQISGGTQYVNNTSHYTSVGVVLVHNNTLYDINFGARNPNQQVDASLLTTFYQILSSFQFTQ